MVKRLLVWLIADRRLTIFAATAQTGRIRGTQFSLQPTCGLLESTEAPDRHLSYVIADLKP